MKKVMVMVILIAFASLGLFAQTSEATSQLYGKKFLKVSSQQAVIYNYESKTYRYEYGSAFVIKDIRAETGPLWMIMSDWDYSEYDERIWLVRSTKSDELLLRAREIKFIGQTDRHTVLKVEYDIQKAAYLIFNDETEEPIKEIEAKRTTIKIKDNKIFANGEEVLLE